MKIYRYANNVKVVETKAEGGKQYSYAVNRYGDLMQKVLDATEKERRKIWNAFDIVESDVVIHYYDKSQEQYYSTIISLEDFEKVREYYWSRSDDGRWRSRGPVKSGHIFLHRFILGENEGLTIDHIDRDITNNRRSNLRFATQSLQNINRRIQNAKTPYTGVDWRDDIKKWRVRLGYKKNVTTEYFIDLDEAIKYRKQLEEQVYDEEKLRVQRLSHLDA